MEPKVSILIPAYNRPNFFIQALQSALKQTYKNKEIIICDDSENDATKKVVENLPASYQTSIQYYKNPYRLGAVKNYQKCLELASGQYINFLNDDDLFHPQKIEAMMHYFLNYTDISLVTSSRLAIDKYGREITVKRKSLKKLFEKDTIIEGKELAEIVLTQRTNYIGEPTTVLFKRDKLDEPFAVYGGKEALCNHDMASWLNLLEKDRAVYLTNPLSFFRIHESQIQNMPGAREEGKKDWEEHLRLWQEKHGKFKSSSRSAGKKI